MSDRTLMTSPWWRWLPSSLGLGVALLWLATHWNVAFGSDASARRFIRMDFSPGREGASGPIPARFQLSFTGKVGTQLRKEVGLPLVYLDILGGKIDLSPVVMPFATGPARLVRLSQVSESPPVVRATFFLRQLVTPRIRHLEDGFEVSFAAEKDSPPAPFQPAIERHPPYPPISPLAEASAPKRRSALPPAPIRFPSPPSRTPAEDGPSASNPPVMLTLDLKGANASTLLRELARQAGMNIHFRDPFDMNLDIQAVASSPLDAMVDIVSRLGGTLTVEDGEIWVALATNPLLRFSDSDVVDRADLRDLALGDVLRALGQMGELNIILDQSVASLRDRPVDMFLHRMTYRRAFETILQAFDLTVRTIDARTLVVMTVQAARQAAGKTVRVLPVQIPFAKLEDLLKKALPSTILERVTRQEDLGNIILVGDKEAVDEVETLVTSLEGKLTRSGEARRREMFAPANTKAEDLLRLVREALPEGERPTMVRDERTDTLIVSGPAESVDRALALMRDLDRQATRQALIHIRLVEMKLRDIDTLGLQLDKNGVTIANLSNFPDRFTLPGAFTDDRNRHRIKTLANPTLRCMDREEATIDISEQIPVKNTVTEYLPVASASLAARTTDNWTTSEVGIKLQVKPFIHHDHDVTLDVNVDLTDLVTLVEGHPWTAKRNIKTRVRVKDHETVVIGGLIRRRTSRERKKLPLISRIPVLRWLSNSVEWRTRDEEETEMVMLITPRVIAPSNGSHHQRTALLPTAPVPGKEAR